MTGTSEGALKSKATLIEKYGEDYFKEIGRKGGKFCSPLKGFGGNHELAVRAGQISRRKSKKEK